MNFDKVKFGERLRTFRKTQELTQTELATILDTTQGNIGHIENGRRRPGAELLINLYVTYRESFEYLLLGSREEDAPGDSSPTRNTPASHPLARRSNALDPRSRLLPPLISLLEAVEQTVNSLNRMSGPETPSDNTEESSG